MTYRIATLDDVEVITSMYRDFFTFNAEMQPLYNQKAECGDYPINTIKSETADIILAEVDGSIAGFTHVLEETTPPYDSVVQYKFATIMDLFVSPQYRKQGVGITLLNAAKEWARKRNLSYIELGVMPENKPALGLYMRENFQTVQHQMRCTL